MDDINTALLKNSGWTIECESPLEIRHDDGSFATRQTAWIVISSLRDEAAKTKPRIFVFGSNLAGRHGAGAALCARREHGAKYGVGVGRTGNAYAIPTKDSNLNTLPLASIRSYVLDFIEYAKEHPELQFTVTRIGCGLAGYKDIDIAPMFKDAPENCDLPEGWR